LRRVVVVTGASRGIGAATARLAADAGYAVCLNFLRNREAADALAEDLRKAGARAIAVQADVAVGGRCGAPFAECDAALGPVTALVNNAGILERRMRVEEMDAGRLQRVIATNVIGSFLCAREAVRRMSTRHGGAGGAIVNVSSRRAHRLA
jgi:NAD(P)-dependent dehydrogenase (short-subunit alcohol dehydrogenase family)